MTIAEKVKEIIFKQNPDLKESEYVPEAHFIDDLGMDSLDVVEMTMAAEDEWGIEIPDEEVGNIETVDDLTRYIEWKVNGGSRPAFLSREKKPAPEKLGVT